jgi:protein-disulfide isomerase
VRLGDQAAGQPAVSDEAFARAKVLRIFYRDVKSGWQPVGVDVPLQTAVETKAAAPQPDLGAIMAELRELRALVSQKDTAHASGGGAPRYVSVPVGDEPALGAEDAPLTLVEFIDFQSGPARMYQAEVFPALVAEYINTGKVRLVSRQLPQLAQSEPAARAALCAHAQGQYWQAREKLFAPAADLGPEMLHRVALDTGIDQARFSADLTAKETSDRVQADAQVAHAAGIAQTPTFVLGRREGGQVHGLLLSGIVPLATWEAEIYKLITTPAAPRQP